jgi:pimeloyl-ACP methyl ester carboxylesterase
MTAVLSTDTTVEYRSKFARNTVNNIAVFNSDSRNLTGHSVGKIGVRKATVTVTPRTGLEGLAPSPNWTTVGNANMRVALPTTYDSRKPAPVVMMFHGNGSNETHFADHVAGKAVANAFLAAGYIVVSAANGPNVSTWGAQAGLDAYYTAYQYVRDHYAIGPVVFYGNSMGGIESLLTLAERRIPGVVAWVGTVPVCNLSANYVGALNAQLFKPTIATAYGIAGDGSDYAAKTVGHDPVLKAGSAFRGVPMWVLVATDDVAVIPSENFDLFQPIVAPYAAELVRVNATGGHSTGAIASNAAAMVAFANKYVTA